MNAPMYQMTDANTHSAFDISNDVAYQQWRDQKFRDYPRSVEQITIAVKNPFALSVDEIAALRSSVQRCNMAIYDLGANAPIEKAVPRAIATQLGLVRLDHHLCVDEDGISPIQVSDSELRHDYIPYTNKPINWHTDGYYNEPDHTICGMLLHCVKPALEGGDNGLIDHEIVYCLLRDENPDWIQAMMQPDVMTIPPNVQNGQVIRAEQTGPVFSVIDGSQPFLHMRYTARAHNIVWKDKAIVRSAVARLREIMDDPNSPYVFRAKLKSGQGVICNNVLHKRTGFNDASEPERKRLLYRARYYDRIR